MRSEPHDGTLIVDNCQINLIMVNYGCYSMDNYWVISRIIAVLRRFSGGLTRGRAIRPAVKRRKRT